MPTTTTHVCVTFAPTEAEGQTDPRTKFLGEKYSFTSHGLENVYHERLLHFLQLYEVESEYEVVLLDDFLYDFFSQQPVSYFLHGLQHLVGLKAHLL